MTILGHSIISETEGYRISKKLYNKKNVVVKSFASAKVEWMSQYISPIISK